MYRAFYSLSGEPFSKGIAPENCFSSRNWSEAKARLQYLVKARGIGVLVGEPGSGKTFALRSLAAGLNPALYRVIYLPLSTGTVMDFYRGLAGGLGEEPKFRKIDLFEQIQRSVLNLFQEKKITPVFILDEMHLASPKFLLDLSILFNFSMDSLNPFVFVLSGLPFLLNRLGLSQTQSLAQRVVMRYKMEPLERDEVKDRTPPEAGRSQSYPVHRVGYRGHRFQLPGLAENGEQSCRHRSYAWRSAQGVSCG